MIEKDQVKGDSLLVDTTDNYILRMVGELLSTSNGEYVGEHKFATKESLKKRKSPIEEKLDKYRGVFDDLTITRIVSRYIDVMKLCRKNRCTADLSNLNLELVSLYGSTWNYSNFCACKFNSCFVDSPELEKEIKFVYFSVPHGAIIVSDLYSAVIIFDIYLNIKKIIKIYQKLSVEVIITDKLVHILELNYDENPFQNPEIEANLHHTVFDLQSHLLTQNKISTKESSAIMFSCMQEVEYIHVSNSTTTSYCVVGRSNTIVTKDKTNQQEVDIFYSKKSEYTIMCDKYHMYIYNSGKRLAAKRIYNKRRYDANVIVDNGGFRFSDSDCQEYHYSGDLLIRYLSSGRIYDTHTKKSIIYGKDLQFNDFNRSFGFLDGRWLSVNSLNNNYKGLEFDSSFVFIKDYHSDDIVYTIDKIPIEGGFTARFFDKGLLFYNKSQLVLCYINDMHFINIPLNIDGYILYNGALVDGNTLYVLYVNVDHNDLLLLHSVHLVKYNLDDNTIIDDINTHIMLSHDISFEEGNINNVNVVIDKEFIVIRNDNELNCYMINYDWKFSFYLYKLGIDQAHRISWLKDGVLIYHDANHHTKLTIELLDETNIDSNTWGECIDYTHNVVESLDIHTMNFLLDSHVIKEQISECPILKIRKQYRIKYLNDTDIRGCDFADAVIKTENGEEKPIPDEILFNT